MITKLVNNNVLSDSIFDVGYFAEDFGPTEGLVLLVNLLY